MFKKTPKSSIPRNALPVRKAPKNPYGFFRALSSGSPVVYASMILMGLGNILAGQLLKGLLFLGIEALFVMYMMAPEGGIFYLKLLPSLGDREMQEIWDDEIYAYTYIMGDDSKLILLYGVVAICVIALMIVVWRASVCSSYKSSCLCRQGKGKAGYWTEVKAAAKELMAKWRKPLKNKNHDRIFCGAMAVVVYPVSCVKGLFAWQKKRNIPNFLAEIKALFDANAHKLMMFLPVALLCVFTVVPLLYMMSMAFTDYNKTNYVLFNWVGFKNFVSIFDSTSSIGRQFGDVLLWTIIWAIFATFLNFIFGTIVAIIINRNGTRCKGLWRGLLSLTIAVPQFVSLMVIRSMLQPEGIVNRMLMDAGIISERLPFMTDVTWTRVTVIIVNLWVGIPYTIMQVTGILKNIPAEQYEAARIDGAGAFQQFKNITVPYMLFVMTPYLITQFTGNINNFNVIYLTTRGEPLGVGNTAGGTDLLVTWLYKLSVDKQNYSMAAVVGIFTFVVLSIVSLITYRSTGSYKDEEGFK